MSQPFAKAIDLLYLAKQNGVDVALNADQLQLKLPKNKSIDKGLIEQLKNNKQLIVDFLKEHQSGNKTSAIQKVERDPAQNIPLSFSQERLWFIHQMEGSLQYHIPAALRLRGELNKTALKSALAHILQRHEVLRTIFLEDEGHTHQVIRDPNDWQLEFIDGTQFSNDEKKMQEFVLQLIRVPFNLSRDYMVRAYLIQVSEQEHLLVVVTHHIASDGWSASIIVKEVIELYSAYSENRQPILSPLPVQYADYAVWQRNFLQGEVLNRKLDYWKQKLSGVVALQLPLDYKRPPVWSSNGSSKSFSIDKHLSDQLLSLSQSQGTTLYMTLLSAFNVLLYKYSGQQDICIGSPIANRTQHEVESLIGFFVNTLALRTEVNGDASFTQLLHQVRATTMEAYEHQDVPFEKVVEVVVKERDLSRNPLFQVMFALQNTPDTPQLRLGNIDLSTIKLPQTTTKFDLTFFLIETAQGIRGDMQFATDLYNEQTIIRMLDHYKLLLSSIVASPDSKVDELVMLPDHEKQTLLNDFNNTRVDYPEGVSIVTLFEEQAARTPDATAIIYDATHVTYKELNERSNQVSHFLMTNGVGREKLIAVCIERGIEMVIGILGILKSGAAYIPIDPEYPQERISYMVEDSMASIVLTSNTARSRIPALEGIDIIQLNDNPAIDRQSKHNISTNIDPRQLAYVIYTSGSTGKPKGVMIEHQNVSSFIFWSRDEFSSSIFDIVYASTSICFDLSVFEIFYPLTTGKKIRILENGMQMEKYLQQDRLVLVNTVPVVIENILNDGTDMTNVSVLNMAGEPVPSTVIQRLDTDRIEVRNLYGPTEDTTYSTVYRMRKDKPVLIGRPISNTRVYILDKKKQLVPVGVAGEIFLSGSGVTRGYLNRAELTAEKFVHDPFRDELNSRVYKTGDLGRWLPDGNIEYLGRIDQQVKVRGYRIELGEIETVLHQSDLVQQAVVLAKKDHSGSDQLVAYVIPGGEFDKQKILAYLKDKLPQYMIPSGWVPLESFPLTPNGKIDKKALPGPEGDEPANEYIPPRDEVEYRLAKIWQKVLSVPQVGINDNFFEIGGHSLMAMRLISSVRKELGSEISIKELFAYPTIKGLALRLGSGSNEMTPPPVVAKPRPAFVPLSFSQERLWFIDRLEGSVHYHMPAVLKLNGNLDTKALNDALTHVVNRHEVLRTVIRDDDGQPYQHIMPQNQFRISIIDGSAIQDVLQLQKVVDDLISQPFDLSNDHMLRASLIRVTDQQYVLVVTMHHIASDGWSLPIVVNEVAELYNAAMTATKPNVPSLKIQYADYAIWQRDYLEGEVLARKIEYWKKALQGIAPLQIPLDYPRPTVQSTRGATLNFKIDKETSAGLQALSQRQGTTLFMTLLASFNVLLHRYSGQQNICIGTPIAGRQQQELENLVGFFVNTLALHTEVNSGIPFANFLADVRDTVLNGYIHQDVPFEKVVENVAMERDMSRSPLFQVMFILQNTPEIPGLHLGDLELSYDTLNRNTSKFDLTFSLTNTREGVIGFIEYCTDLFSEQTIMRMMVHFQNLLKSIVKDPHQRVGMLPMLTQDEELLIRGFNDTKVDYPGNKSIVDLFEAQAAKTPESIAIIFGEKQLTYRQLNQRANQFAHFLVTKGVKPESLIPVCVERSVEMIVCVLGILKTGSAYVPIDPAYPQDRISFKLNDTGAKLIISCEITRYKLESEFPIEIFDIDRDWPAVDLQPTTNLNIPIEPHHRVYVIYTSGSTGKPKGVQMTSCGLVNLLFWQEKQFTNKNRRVLQFASFNFDVSFQEIFSTLCFGSTLCIISEADRRDPAQMIEILKDYGITHLFIPYIVLKSLSEYVLAIPQPSLQLQEIIVAGEQLKLTEDIRTVLAATNTELVNQYGPTEAHVVSSYRIDKSSIPVLPPIGKPVDNTQLYLLNESGSLVPVGVPGEIYIGGVQVAHGYLNRPHLTEEKFVPDPFSSDKDARLYRTGDLAKWLPDGNLEYLGRIDDQVKIRGYRIEIGEIESVLEQFDGVRQAVVMVREDVAGNRRLVGFVVPEGHFDPDAIVNFLQQRLPDYMVPTQWVKMENMPVTGNGKIDRKALPLTDNTPSSHAYVPPSNETEEKLVEIWQKLLGIDNIGIKNNFFEVGGHSLLAMRLIAAIRRQMGVDLPLIDIYESDIQSLASKITSQQKIDNINPHALPFDSGTSGELTEAFEMAQRMEKGIVEWGVNGHGKYLVPIKKKGTKNPFFGIISFKQYRLLGSLMPDDQPLFYLPPTRSASVEEIAAHYIKEMKLSHPGGPYTIGGFCGAGMIALEIAQQLQAQGDEVSALILFEYYAPESMLRKRSLKYKKRLLGRYKRRLIAYKRSTLSNLDVFKFILKRTYKGFRDFLNPPPPKFITSPKYNNYTHKPYSGKVILFQASIPPLEATNSPLMGWSKYFSGPVELITIQGGHLGIFRQPEIKKLAEELTAVLEELNNEVAEIQKSIS